MSLIEDSLDPGSEGVTPNADIPNDELPDGGVPNGGVRNDGSSNGLVLDEVHELNPSNQEISDRVVVGKNKRVQHEISIESPPDEETETPVEAKKRKTIQSALSKADRRLARGMDSKQFLENRPQRNVHKPVEPERTGSSTGAKQPQKKERKSNRDDNTTSVEDTEKKEAEEKRERILTTRNYYLWYQRLCIKDKLENGRTFTKEEKEIFADLYKDFEETNCSELIDFEEDHDYQMQKQILMALMNMTPKQAAELKKALKEPKQKWLKIVRTPLVREGPTVTPSQEEVATPEDGTHQGVEQEQGDTHPRVDLNIYSEVEEKKESGKEEKAESANDEEMESEDRDEMDSVEKEEKELEDEAKLTTGKAKKRTKKAYIPMVEYTTPLLQSFLRNATAETLVKLAIEGMEKQENLVYGNDHKSIDKKAAALYALRKGFVFEHEQKKSGVVGIHTLNVTNKEDLEHMKERVYKTSACLIRGATEAVGIDLKKFSCDALEAVAGGQKIKVLLQRAQPCNENFPMKNGNRQGWDVESETIEMTLTEYMKQYREKQETTRRTVEEICGKSTEKDELLQEMTNSMMEMQYTLNGKRYSFATSAFATNLDLNEKCPDQLGEIKKLSEFLTPWEGMMRFLKETIPGVNAIQCYIKEPGSRTPCHQENQLVASVNINVGPGDCVWFNVSMFYSRQMEELMKKKNVFPFHTKYWPNEKDLIEAGIPYQKVIQKPGDIMYIGIGTYHWVQANSYCVNVAWNVAELSAVQLAAAAFSHDHNAEQRYETQLPIASLLWQLAQADHIDAELKKLTKQLLIRPLVRSQCEWYYSVEVLRKTPRSIKNCELEIKEVLRCTNLRCRRHELHNIVCVEKENDQKYTAKCVECVNPQKEFDVYYMNTMDKLKKIFDNCV